MNSLLVDTSIVDVFTQSLKPVLLCLLINVTFYFHSLMGCYCYLMNVLTKSVL